MIGVAGLGLRWVWAHVVFQVRLRSMVVAADPLALALLHECKEVMGVRQRVIDRKSVV